jgi:hypothetical protein
MGIKARLEKLEAKATQNGGVLVLPLYLGDDQDKRIADWERGTGRARPDCVVLVRKFSHG